MCIPLTFNRKYSYNFVGFFAAVWVYGRVYLSIWCSPNHNGQTKDSIYSIRPTTPVFFRGFIWRSKYYRLKWSLTPIFRNLACSGPSIPAATRCPEMDRFEQNQDVSFSTGPPPSVQCDLPGTDGSRSNTNCLLHKPTSKIVIKEIHLYIYIIYT